MVFLSVSNSEITDNCQHGIVLGALAFLWLGIKPTQSKAPIICSWVINPSDTLNQWEPSSQQDPSDPGRETSLVDMAYLCRLEEDHHS